MTDLSTRDLDAHDALPDAPSVVVVRRFAEDDPSRTVIEIVVTAPRDRAVPTPGLSPDASWQEATSVAGEIALALDLQCVWRIDRTAGKLEQAVLRAHGDRSAPGVSLDDDDLEDGEPGADMRDHAGPGSRERG